METATKERRRNQFSDNCGVCRCEVKAGEGWLYSMVDGVRGRARRNRHGGFRKFVKCDRCHSGSYAHACQLPENQPAKSAIAKVSIAELRSGKLEFTHEKWGNWTEHLARWTLADGRSEVICYPRAITGEPVLGAIDLTYDEPLAYGGKLTPAAAKEYNAICGRSLPLYAAYLESR